MSAQKVTLTMKRFQHYETCRAVLDRRMTVRAAAGALGLSERQVYRIKKRVERQGIKGIELSDETLRLWLRPMGHGRPVRRVKVHRGRRERKAREGEMLFLDGSPHPWFGREEPESCLLLSSDDASGDPTRHGGTHRTQSLEAEDTHWQRSMKELAIELIFAHSPQARGRGERLNGSFQDRLVAELSYHGIKDCVSATRYLNRVFIPRYRRKFRKPPADPTPAWRPAPPADLKAILCARYTRTVANDNTVSLDGTRYQLYPPMGRYHLVKARLEVQQRFDGTVHFFHERYGEIKGRAVVERSERVRAGVIRPTVPAVSQGW